MSINQQKAINFQINSKAEKKGFQNTLFINVDQKETEGEMNRDNSAELKHNTPKSTISNLSDFKFIGKDLMNKINDISPPLKYIASNLNKISSKDLCIQGEENDENCFNPFFMKSLNSFDSSGGEFYKRNSLANKDCEFNDPERSYTSRNENKQIMINRVDTFSIEEKNSMEELSDEKKDPVVDDIMKAQKQKDIEFVQRPILKTINRNSNGVSQQGNFQEKVKNFNPEFLRDNNVNFPLVAYQQMYYNYLNDMNKENSNAQQFNKNIDYANSAKDCAKVIPNTMEPHPTGRQPIADQECNKANTIINRPEEQRADNQPKMKESNICTQPSKKVITINNPTETEYTQGYKYGKQGWLCLSCNNFNWESKSN